MAQYRKKPVVIEAVQFDGTDESCDWLLPELKGGSISRTCNKLHIKTLEGVMTADIGDYIIRGVHGEFYPCKPDIFEKTYVKADNENMNFGQAIEELKKGNKLARAGWNGKGMYVVYQKGYPQGIACNSNTAEAFKIEEGTVIKVQPYFSIKNVNNSISTWVPSVNDCIAEDWNIAE